MAIEVPISPGELIDKLTILEIKLENIRDQAKVANVQREYDALSSVSRSAVPESDELEKLRSLLRETNRAIWRVEDLVRKHERNKDFGSDFIELARTAYLSNDVRAAAKRKINDLLKSSIIEEKSHSA